MGHHVAECDQYGGAPTYYVDEDEPMPDEPMPDYADDRGSETNEIPDYMNEEDPEMDQIPGPTIRPQINLAQIGAQMNALTNKEYSELIQQMGETHPQDFLEA